MKPIVLIPVVLLLAAVTSYAVARLAGNGSEPALAAPSPGADPAERGTQALSDLEARLSALTKSVEDLRADLASRPREDARVPVGDIQAAVARALKEQSEPVAEGNADADPTAPKEKAYDSEAAFAELLDLSWEDSQAKWKEIEAAGGLAEMVAAFERYAKEHPDSPDAQVKLGDAFLQMVFRSGNGPETGMWATKADRAFDAALSLDDRHWEARFSKAISLSFWPPVFGKQTEAIKHFEILVEQQAGLPSHPDHAETWLLLGNMYQQLGKSDQALTTWQKGLALFPDNTQIQQQIANAQGGSGH